MKIFNNYLGFELFLALVGGLYVVIITVYNVLNGKYKPEAALGILFVIFILAIVTWTSYFLFYKGAELQQSNIENKEPKMSKKMLGVVFIFISILIFYLISKLSI